MSNNLHNICTDCYEVVEYMPEETGNADGWKSHLLKMLDNGVNPHTLHHSTVRVGHGWEHVPSETFSTAPCTGCGSTLAGERHPYETAEV